MLIDPENLSAQKSRVLFTGSAGRVLDDLMKRVSPEYQLEKCQPQEQSFVHTLNSFDPHVIVACLSDESAESMRMFSLLEGSAQLLELPIIAIGNDEDCNIFRRYVSRKNTRIFERPLNREQFFETLANYVELQRRLMRSLEQTGAAQSGETPGEAAEDAQGGSAQEPEKKKSLSSFGSERGTILVVDDDVRMLNMAKLCLQDMYDVVVVPSGKLALKYLSKKAADLVLLDYMMPEQDGPSVLSEIRRSSSQPDIPVLFLTGVDDKDMVLRGLEFHPSGYLLKPVTRDTLVAKVAEILLGL